MNDTKDMYFFTLDNLNEFDDEKEISDEELKERILNNYKLSKENSSIEKRLMLLNNCLINFRKIKGDIPFDLLFLVYNDLIFYNVKLENIDEAYNYLMALYSEYEKSFNNEYSLKMMNLVLILVNLANKLENYEVSINNIKLISEIYENSEKNDYEKIVYSKAVSIYSSLFFYAKKFDDALNLQKKAFDLIVDISDDIKEKNDYLAAIIFSMGNICFQADYNDKAEYFLKKAIKLCVNNEFDSKYEVTHMSFNYLAQVYVYTGRYDEAIDLQIKYLDMYKEEYSGDNHLYVCADFLFRIGLIYIKYKEKITEGKKYMQAALITLNKINDKSDDVLDFIDTVADYL